MQLMQAESLRRLTAKIVQWNRPAGVDIETSRVVSSLSPLRGNRHLKYRVARLGAYLMRLDCGKVVETPSLIPPLLNLNKWEARTDF